MKVCNRINLHEMDNCPISSDITCCKQARINRAHEQILSRADREFHTASQKSKGKAEEREEKN